MPFGGTVRIGSGGGRRPAVVGVLVIALFVVVASVSPGGASVAAEPVGPVIASYVDGDHVSGQIEVTVESAAPYVLIAWAAEVDSPRVYATQTLNGTATASVTTSGYAGPTTIVARECQNQCAGDDGSTTVPAETSVQVNVSNPPPTFEGTWISEWHGDFVLYWLAEQGPWAWHAAFIDGKYVPPVTNGPLIGAPVDYIGDGVHTLQVARCTKLSMELVLDPPVCDMANATQLRQFTVRTALHPVITALRPRTISPDGNGIADAASVRVELESAQWLRWSLEQESEEVVAGPVADEEAGPYTFKVPGIDTQGQPLASGEYTLRVVTRSDPHPPPGVDDETILGETSTTLRIDLEAPDVHQASATPPVFHPPIDGYRDRVRIAGRLSEPASRLRIRLLHRGLVVRRLWLGPHPAGGFSAAWDGRGPKGRLLRRGTYRYEFVVRDRAGNEAIRPGGEIQLRWTR